MSRYMSKEDFIALVHKCFVIGVDAVCSTKNDGDELDTIKGMSLMTQAILAEVERIEE